MNEITQIVGLVWIAAVIMFVVKYYKFNKKINRQLKALKEQEAHRQKFNKHFKNFLDFKAHAEYLHEIGDYKSSEYFVMLAKEEYDMGITEDKKFWECEVLIND